MRPPACFLLPSIFQGCETARFYTATNQIQLGDTSESRTPAAGDGTGDACRPREQEARRRRAPPARPPPCSAATPSRRSCSWRCPRSR